jgi:hypothetical protein
MPRTELTMKIALLDAYGYNAREISDEVGCTHNHVRNLRTHPDYRKLLREFYDGQDFDGSLAFRVYEQRLARLAYAALDALGEQLTETLRSDDGEDTGLPQPQIRQGAAKEILGAVGRHVAAHARASSPTAGSSGGSVTVHLHLDEQGKVLEIHEGEEEDVIDG